MGWKTFDTEPTDEFITIYIEDEDETFWICTAKWDFEVKAVRYSDIAPFQDKGMKILLWRERPPEPRSKLKKKATPAKYIED